MNSYDFCLLENNLDSNYCTFVKAVGPIPPQYEVVYPIGAFSLLLCTIFMILSPVILLSSIGGKK